MKKPGILLELPDKRLVIVYNNQPLLPKHGKVVLHLIDKNHNLIKDEAGKPKTIIKTLDAYNLENQENVNKLIGYVD